VQFFLVRDVERSSSAAIETDVGGRLLAILLHQKGAQPRVDGQRLHFFLAAQQTKK
jgi:hypothetical protein